MASKAPKDAAGRGPGRVSVEEASRMIKEHAAAQKVAIRLTDEQMRAILDQYKVDPSRPFELTFQVEGRDVADLRVASCAYWGDTCCA